MPRFARRLVWIGVLIAPLAFGGLPAEWVENGPFRCPSRLLLEVDCPGCGLTRATYHALHGHWERAWDYNPLVAVALPVGVGLWLYWLWQERKVWRPPRSRGE
ncbi:MAG: hypothetical protein KatS3mg026_1680 [Bacteroidia bacterium]|nr:MAG: hypothetical protein KatS3mg026_1680 [Bacteroidia bacterium]